MAKILINDGIHNTGEKMLKEKGHDVVIEKVPQENLSTELPQYDAIVVRSATKVRKELIDQCPNLKVIARGGVGLDNIDVDYARSKGIEVINTPAASSRSVAELAIAHAFALARKLHMANRAMPHSGQQKFKQLKKEYSAGFELSKKSLGIIGFGRIGQELAKIALALGMKVVATDPQVDSADMEINIQGAEQKIVVRLHTIPLEGLLEQADIISIHVPGGENMIGKEELEKMKNGVLLINTSRGGVINEDALLDAIDEGKVGGAALDVFSDEPTPSAKVLDCNKISLSPHIGASTGEAQENVGIELAQKINAYFSNQN